jgi:cytochrome P450
MNAPPARTVDLLDPRSFARNDFHSTLAWLRAHDPVHRHPEPDGPGFWAVTRHRDIVDVYAHHDVFSSRYGMRLGSNTQAVAAVSQRMLIVSDPPNHTQVKKVLQKAFGASELPAIEELVRRVVREVLDEAIERRAVDFIDIAKQIPNHVVCALMGIPRADWEWIGDVTTEAFEGDGDEDRSGAHGEIFLYFTDLLAQRRGGTGNDVVSQIARDPRPDGRLLSDEEVVFNCNGVLAGANETTRYSTAGGVLAFADHPDQWTRLRLGGSAGVPAAVEEILRWTTPGVHALRTVMKPATIGGVDVAPGDRVTLWNASANRDEDVFGEPDRFLVDRTPNRHITFGHGRHVCLGARLARIELAAFLEGFLRRVREVELTGTPYYNASNFTWGLRSLPVRLLPA